MCARHIAMGAVLFPETELLQGENKETKKDFV